MSSEAHVMFESDTQLILDVTLDDGRTYLIDIGGPNNRAPLRKIEPGDLGLIYAPGTVSPAHH